MSLLLLFTPAASTAAVITKGGWVESWVKKKRKKPIPAKVTTQAKEEPSEEFEELQVPESKQDNKLEYFLLIQQQILLLLINIRAKQDRLRQEEQLRQDETKRRLFAERLIALSAEQLLHERRLEWLRQQIQLEQDEMLLAVILD